MKDRIKKVMESQRMTQQEFADFIHISPASLSSIFTGRTRPTLAIVEAVKNALPKISTDWLMFGTGAMWIDADGASAATDGGLPHTTDRAVPEGVGTGTGLHSTPSDILLDFDAIAASAASNAQPPSKRPQAPSELCVSNAMVKNTDKPRRTITEIRIFFSDQTWETFVPKK